MQKIYMSEYEKRMKELRECFVSHAEIEFLYDPEGKETGFIDPNALSAGGFPLVFRHILEQLSLKEQTLSEQSKQLLQRTMAEAFPRIAIPERKNIVDSICASLESMGVADEAGVELFVQEFKKKSVLLSEQYKSEFVSRVVKLFSTEFGIAWVAPSFWATFRRNKVKAFRKLVEDRQNLGSIPVSYLTSVRDYLDMLVETFGKVQGNHFATVDVEWESDVSYYIAEKLAEKGIETDVYSDLHSNSGLFAKVPLKVIMAPYGCKVYPCMYSMLVSPDRREISVDKIVLGNKNCSIEVGKKSRKMFLEKGVEIDLSGMVFMPNEILTPSFKQYAYLWEHFDKSALDMNNESHRKMFLSNLLNAKSGFFSILAEEEKQTGVTVSRPATWILSRGEVIKDIDNLSEIVTLKEGGWCSTGGKQVSRHTKSEVNQQLRNSEYVGPFVQNYTPSILFYQGDVPMHGHVRKASMIGRDGSIAHAGYVIKLIPQEKGNSSAYRSHILAYDENLNFMFGWEAGCDEKIYTDLADANLRSVVDMGKVFVLAKEEWLKAMYLVNKFIAEEDLHKFVSKMAESAKISEQYLVKQF